MSQERKKGNKGKITLFLIALFLAVVAWVMVNFKNAQEKNTEPTLGYVYGEQVQDSLVFYQGPRYGEDEQRVSLEGFVERIGSFSVPILVTARNIETGNRVSVSTQDGNFHIPDLYMGKYVLSAQSGSVEAMYADTVLLENDMRLSGQLELNDNFRYSYPSGYYAAKLQFPTEEIKDDARLSCGYCHSIANPIFRLPRHEDAFSAIVARMDAYGALPKRETRAALPAIFAQGFSGINDPQLPDSAFYQQFAQQYYATDYMVKEWPMGVEGAYIHDIAVGSEGWITGVDMEHDNVYSRNIETGEYYQWHLNPRSHPLGGSYASGMSRPVGTTYAHLGPHSVEYADGIYWITASLGNEIVAFDPGQATSRRWSLPFKTFYPHTLRVTEDEVLFSVALSNHLGRLSLTMHNNSVEVLELPTTSRGQDMLRDGLAFSFGYASRNPGQDRHMDWWLKMFRGNGSENMPLAYGIDLHPTQPLACYSQVNINRIGCVNLETNEVVVDVETPFKGPRRLRFGPDGTLWIPGFVSGTLAAFNIETQEFEDRGLLPVPLENWKEQPYALNVHPETGNIWITSTAYDVLYEFYPNTGEWQIYALPLRGAYIREIEFTQDGWVCASYASTPDYHVPDRSVKLMCLKPQ